MTQSQYEPPWLAAARKYEGLKEVPGPTSSPVILAWLGRIKAGWLGGDDAPWCGTALANWMLEASIEPPPAPYRALNWERWGVRLAAPVVGAVGVMRRPGGAHVTLAVGVDRDGNILGFGGNQRDGVRVSPFKADRFTAWRWPHRYPTLLVRMDRQGLPLGSADGFGGSEA